MARASGVGGFTPARTNATLEWPSGYRSISCFVTGWIRESASFFGRAVGPDQDTDVPPDAAGEMSRLEHLDDWSRERRVQCGLLSVPH